MMCSPCWSDRPALGAPITAQPRRADYHNDRPHAIIEAHTSDISDLVNFLHVRSAHVGEPPFRPVKTRVFLRFGTSDIRPLWSDCSSGLISHCRTSIRPAMANGPRLSRGWSTSWSKADGSCAKTIRRRKAIAGTRAEVNSPAAVGSMKNCSARSSRNLPSTIVRENG